MRNPPFREPWPHNALQKLDLGGNLRLDGGRHNWGLQVGEIAGDQADRPNRLLALDLIRAILAIEVVAIHAQYYTGYATFLSGSILCVFYFFVLSGFVLANAYERKIVNGRFTFRDFLVARFARLVPLHFITLAAVIVIWCAFGAIKHHTGIILGDTFNYKSNELFETLTLTQFIFGGGPAFNSPSWSIGVEWWCGLGLFFLMMPIRPELKVAVTIASILIFGALDIHYKIGMICLAIGWTTHSIASRLSPMPTIVQIAALLVALVISMMTSETTFSKIPVIDVIQVSVLPFAVAVGLCARFKFSRIVTPALRAMGDWSYGIYLWHYPCIFVTLAAFKLLAPSAIQTPTFYIVLYALVIAVSAFSFAFIEHPLQSHILRALKRPAWPESEQVQTA